VVSGVFLLGCENRESTKDIAIFDDVNGEAQGDRVDVLRATIEGDWLVPGFESIVRIRIKDDVATGVVHVLADSQPEGVRCEACPGKRQGQRILGMDIITGLVKHDGEWRQGKIINPEDGLVVDCRVFLSDDNKLEVKPTYNGEAIGQDSIWTRVNVEA